MGSPGWLSKLSVALLVWASVSSSVSSTAASAATTAAYTDTKRRFEVTLAGGWELAPLPGDTLGMNFRRIVSGVPASLHVMVEKAAPGETISQSLQRADAGFREELGYNPGTDVPVTVGQLKGVRRSLSVYASGDKNTVRAVELYVLHAFGFVHVLHFETLEKKRSTFTKDLDRMLSSYVAIAGRDLIAPLGGLWLNTGGGPDLTLEDNGEFHMGPLNGGWQADGGQIVLTIPSGAERYRYLQNGDTLTLSSPNLGGDLVFRRSNTGVKKAALATTTPPKRSGEVRREELIGSWTVLDQASTEVLKLKLAASGSVSFGPLSGRWRYSTGRLTITSTAGSTITYAASLTAGNLVLSGGDLERELVFERD